MSPEMDGIRRRKRGPSIKLFGNELCQICNRKADGYHYNVLSCQGNLIWEIFTFPIDYKFQVARVFTGERLWWKRSIFVEPAAATVT